MLLIDTPLQEHARGANNADSFASADATTDVGLGLEHSRRTWHNVRILVVVWYVSNAPEHPSFSMSIMDNNPHGYDELTTTRLPPATCPGTRSVLRKARGRQSESGWIQVSI